jgi:hypothetical protein
MKKILILIYLLSLTAMSCEYRTELPQTLKIHSQKDLDSWKCELEGLTQYEGNIHITPSLFDTSANATIDISDLSAFKSLKVIKGDLIIASTSLTTINSFSNLEEVESLLVFDNDNIREVEMTNLKIVNQKLSLSGNDALQKIVVPNVAKLVTLYVLDNPKLESIEGFYNLRSLITFSVERCNLMVLDGFNQLENIENLLNLQFEKMMVEPGSFSNLNTADRVSIVIPSHNEYFNWLANLRTYSSLTIAGNVKLSDVCSIKGALLSPYFSMISWNTNNAVYTSSDVEKDCN